MADKSRVPVVDSRIYLCFPRYIDSEKDTCGAHGGTMPIQLFKNSDETYELRIGEKIYGNLTSLRVKMPETPPMWESYYIDRPMTRGQALILDVTYNDSKTDKTETYTCLLAFDKKESTIDKKESTIDFLQQLSNSDLQNLVTLEAHIGEIALLKSKDVLSDSETDESLFGNAWVRSKSWFNKGGGRKKNKTKKKRNKSKKKSKKRRKSKSNKRRKSKSK